LSILAVAKQPWKLAKDNVPGGDPKEIRPARDGGNAGIGIVPGVLSGRMVLQDAFPGTLCRAKSPMSLRDTRAYIYYKRRGTSFLRQINRGFQD